MARSAVFVVRLSRASKVPVSVDYTTVPGTAVSPSDFTAVAGTINFAAGQTTAQIVVPVRGDIAGATEERFTVELSAPYNAALNKRAGIGVLPGRAVDSQPHITIDNPVVPSL